MDKFQVMLFSGKHFGCECVRCLDPTEMGSFCSALLCQRCLPNIPESDKKGDWADRIAVLPDQPIDLNSQWKCRKCSNPHQMTGKICLLQGRPRDTLFLPSSEDVCIPCLATIFYDKCGLPLNNSIHILENNHITS